MRIRAFLTRRYNLPQSAAITLPPLGVSMAASFTSNLFGLPTLARFAISFTILFALLAVTVTFVNRRING
jgi:hypothetical protein